MTNPRIIRKTSIEWTFNSDDSLWYSQPIQVSSFRDVGITVVGTGDVQALGSKQWDNNQQIIPLFTDPSIISNSYVAVIIADETTPNTYVTTFSVSASTKIGELNTNMVTYVCLTRSTDTVDAFLTYCDNS